MQPINLSTRPFYNHRLVSVSLGVLSLLVLGLTMFNVVQAVRRQLEPIDELSGHLGHRPAAAPE